MKHTLTESAESIKPAMQNTVVEDSKGSNWSKERRQQFIDFRLQWDGRLNRSDLVRFFDISVQQASADISDYARQWSRNIAYDKSFKTYVATPEFKAIYPNSGTQQYLGQLLAIQQGVLPPDRSLIGYQPPTASVPIPERTVDEGTIKQLLRAIENKQMLFVEYQSITRDEPRGRYISPHALAYDGLRWHVRAFCHLRGEFDDIVIGRILEVADTQPSPIDPIGDTEWHEQIDIVLAPHPELTPAQREGVEIDYRMEGGKVHLVCRRAMLYYTLRRLGLETDGSPPKYPKQVVLANLDELTPILKKHLRK